MSGFEFPGVSAPATQPRSAEDVDLMPHDLGPGSEGFTIHDDSDFGLGEVAGEGAPEVDPEEFFTEYINTVLQVNPPPPDLHAPTDQMDLQKLWNLVRAKVNADARYARELQFSIIQTNMVFMWPEQQELIMKLLNERGAQITELTDTLGRGRTYEELKALFSG